MTDWSSVVVALISAGAGGGILKIAEGWLNRAKFKSDQDKQFRDELRTEANELRVRIDALNAEIKIKEKELDEWREKYWKIYMQYRMFQIEVSSLLIKNNIDPKIVLNDNALPELDQN